VERSGQYGAALLLGEIFLDSSQGSQCQTVSRCCSLVAGAGANAEAGEPQGHGPAPFLLTERGKERGMEGWKGHNSLEKGFGFYRSK